MLVNYLKIAIRIFSKHKLYTIINIFGLATSLAFCLVAIGHVCYETSFEDGHLNKDRIYRINATYQSADTLNYSSKIMSPLGPALLEEIPEIEYTAVFRVLGDVNIKVGANSYISDKDRTNTEGYLHEGNVLCANSDFLKVFTLPLIQGDPDKVLSEPYSILITQKAANEFFPNQNPVGQIVRLNDRLICQVTGVLKDIPENTQIYCHFIVSYASLESIGEDIRSWDRFDNDYVYVLLREGTDKEAIEGKIPAVINKYLSAESAPKYSFELQPLKDIYFSYYGSGRHGDLAPHGELSMIIEMSVTVGFILLLAMANFINLSTARSSDRIKEVGMRKVLGARRWNLIRQFLGESILITFISVSLGLVLYEFLKIWMEPLLGREALVNFYDSPHMIISVIILTLTVGTLAGFYPAIYLSRFRPISILQMKAGTKSSKSILRKGLVVFQFAIAAFFICATIILYNQVSFMSSLDMGFKKENVVILNFWGDDAIKNCQLMKNELGNSKHVLMATAVDAAPGQTSNIFYGYFPNEERRDEDMIIARTYMTDHDFLSMFGLEIISGRGFSREISGDEDHSMIINESMVKYLNIDNPIGFKFFRKNGFYEVVGVVRDFYGTLQNYEKNNSAAIILNPMGWKTLAVQIPSGNVSESVAAIEKIWQATLPGQYFDYSFLEDEIDKSFNDISGTVTMFMILAVLAISMGSLGIFGLVAYTAQQKTKEIGIRKVMGASIGNIIGMLSKEFVILVVISNIIAWPLAYYLTDDILQYFVKKADVGAAIFMITGVGTLAMAMAAAGYQAIRAARTNPVETLRYE